MMPSLTSVQPRRLPPWRLMFVGSVAQFPCRAGPVFVTVAPLPLSRVRRCPFASWEIRHLHLCRFFRVARPVSLRRWCVTSRARYRRWIAKNPYPPRGLNVYLFRRRGCRCTLLVKAGLWRLENW